MPIDLLFQSENEYLRVDASGVWTTKAAQAAIEKIHETATIQKHTRILCNCADLSQPETEVDRFFTGTAIAAILRHPYKLVVVYPIEYTNKLTENVAVNRGARFLVTHDEQHALEWLLS